MFSISKESIFTGLNNLDVFSILAPEYDEYFGFTQKEVNEMANYYLLEDKLDNIKAWYDGYRFGDVEIYNPWSICKYMSRESKHFVAYWANTATNTEVKELIIRGGNKFRDELDILLKGGIVEKVLFEEIPYEMIYKKSSLMYSFLVFAGCLKAIRTDKYENGRIVYQLQIPNKEVELIFNDLLDSLLDDFIGDEASEFIDFIFDGDVDAFEEELGYAMKGISFHDVKDENSYHMYLFGLLFRKNKNYVTLSNRESGKGRYDVCVKETVTNPQNQKRAVILELKKVRKKQNLDQFCEKALKQAKQKQYNSDLILEGYEDIKIYGVAFKGKECKVLLDEEC